MYRQGRDGYVYTRFAIHHSSVTVPSLLLFCKRSCTYCLKREYQYYQGNNNTRENPVQGFLRPGREDDARVQKLFLNVNPRIRKYRTCGVESSLYTRAPTLVSMRFCSWTSRYLPAGVGSWIIWISAKLTSSIHRPLTTLLHSTSITAIDMHTKPNSDSTECKRNGKLSRDLESGPGAWHGASGL
jgi:hypothetical protein